MILVKGQGEREKKNIRVYFTYGKPGHISANYWYAAPSSSINEVRGTGRSRYRRGRARGRRNYGGREGPYLQEESLVSNPRGTAKAAKEEEHEFEGGYYDFPPTKANIARTGVTDNQWYIDSYASQHILNNRDLFVSISNYSKIFETASDDTITAVGIENVYLHQPNRASLLIENIAYVPKC